MKLIIDGRYQTNRKDARRRILVDNRAKWLTQKAFGYLVVLVAARLRGTTRIPGSSFPGHKDEVRGTIISRLRNQSGLPISYKRLIGYRLEVEPSDITRERGIR